MQRSCCIPKCPSRSHIRGEKTQTYFISFPCPKKYSELYKSWIEVIQHYQYYVLQDSQYKQKKFFYVCDHHFKKSEILHSNSEYNTKTLIEGAIPSIFQYNQSLIAVLTHCKSSINIEIFKNRFCDDNEELDRISQVKDMNEDEVPIIINAYSLVDNPDVVNGSGNVPIKQQDPFKNIPEYILNHLADNAFNELSKCKYTTTPHLTYQNNISYNEVVVVPSSTSTSTAQPSSSKLNNINTKPTKNSPLEPTVHNEIDELGSASHLLNEKSKSELIKESEKVELRKDDFDFGDLEKEKSKGESAKKSEEAELRSNDFEDIQKEKSKGGSIKESKIVNSVNDDLEDIQEDEAKLIAESLFFSPPNTSASEAELTPQKNENDIVYVDGVPDESTLPVIVSDVKSLSSKKDDVSSQEQPIIRITPKRQRRAKDEVVINEIISSDDEEEDDAGAYDDDNDSEYNPEEDDSTDSGTESDDNQEKKHSKKTTQPLLTNKWSSSGDKSQVKVVDNTVGIGLTQPAQGRFVLSTTNQQRKYVQQSKPVHQQKPSVQPQKPVNQAINLLNKKKSEIEDSIKKMVEQQKAKDQLERLNRESAQRRNRITNSVKVKEAELKSKLSGENPVHMAECKKCHQKVSKQEELVKHICPVLQNQLLKAKAAPKALHLLHDSVAETVINEDKVEKAKQIASSIPISRMNNHDTKVQKPYYFASAEISSPTVNMSRTTSMLTSVPPTPVPMYVIAPPNSSASSQVVFFPKTSSLQVSGPNQLLPGQQTQASTLYIPVTVYNKNFLSSTQQGIPPSSNDSPSSNSSPKTTDIIAANPGSTTLNSRSTTITSGSHIMNYGSHLLVQPQTSLSKKLGRVPLYLQPVTVTSNVGSLMQLKTGTTTSIRPGSQILFNGAPVSSGVKIIQASGGLTSVRPIPYDFSSSTANHVLRPITLRPRSVPIQPTGPVQVRYTTPVQIRPANAKVPVTTLNNISNIPNKPFQRFVQISLPSTSASEVAIQPLQYVQISNVTNLSPSPTISSLAGSTSNAATAVSSDTFTSTNLTSSPSKPPAMQPIGAAYMRPVYMVAASITTTLGSIHQPISIPKRDSNIPTSTSIEIIDLSADPVQTVSKNFRSNSSVTTDPTISTASIKSISSASNVKFVSTSMPTIRAILPANPVSNNSPRAILSNMLHSKSMALNSVATPIDSNSPRAILSTMLHSKSMTLNSVATPINSNSPRAILSTLLHSKSTTLNSLSAINQNKNNLQTITSSILATNHNSKLQSTTTSTPLVKPIAYQPQYVTVTSSTPSGKPVVYQPQYVTLSDDMKKKYGIPLSGTPKIIQVVPTYTVPKTPISTPINLQNISGVVTTASSTSNHVSSYTTNNPTMYSQQLLPATATTTSVQTVSSVTIPPSTATTSATVLYNSNGTPIIAPKIIDRFVLATSISNSNIVNSPKNVVMPSAARPIIRTSSSALRLSISQNTLAVNQTNSKPVSNVINRFTLNSDKILVPSNQMVKVSGEQNLYYVLPQGVGSTNLNLTPPINIAAKSMPIRLMLPATTTRMPMRASTTLAFTTADRYKVTTTSITTPKEFSRFKLSTTSVSKPPTTLKETITIDRLPTLLPKSNKSRTFPTPNITPELLKQAGFDENGLFDKSSTIKISMNSPITKTLISTAIPSLSSSSTITTTTTSTLPSMVKEPSIPIQLGVSEKLFRMAKTKRKVPNFMANRYDTKFASSLGFDICLQELSKDYFNLEKSVPTKLSVSDYFSSFWFKNKRMKTKGAPILISDELDKDKTPSGDDLIIITDQTESVNKKNKAPERSNKSSETSQTGISDTRTILEHLRESGNDIAKAMNSRSTHKVLSPPSRLSSSVLSRILSYPASTSTNSTISSISTTVSSTESVSDVDSSICKSKRLETTSNDVMETATATEQIESFLNKESEHSGSADIAEKNITFGDSCLSVTEQSLLRKRKNSFSAEDGNMIGNKKPKSIEVEKTLKSIPFGSSRESRCGESRLRTRIKAKKNAILIDDDEDNVSPKKDTSKNENDKNIFDILNSESSSSLVQANDDIPRRPQFDNPVRSIIIKPEPEDNEADWISTNTALTSYVDESMEDSKSDIQINLQNSSLPLTDPDNVPDESNQTNNTEKDLISSGMNKEIQSEFSDEVEESEITSEHPINNNETMDLVESEFFHGKDGTSSNIDGESNKESSELSHMPLNNKNTSNSNNNDNDNADDGDNSVNSENELMVIVDSDSRDLESDDSLESGDSLETIDISSLSPSQLNPIVVIEKLDLSNFCLL